jgi:hypothetical protein
LEAFPEGYLMGVDDPGNVAAAAASSPGHLCYGVSDCSLSSVPVRPAGEPAARVSGCGLARWRGQRLSDSHFEVGCVRPAIGHCRPSRGGLHELRQRNGTVRELCGVGAQGGTHFPRRLRLLQLQFWRQELLVP